MTVVVIAIIAVVLVLVVGVIIFRLMRGAQTTVPEVADAKPEGTAVVGLDEHGALIVEAQEPQEPPRGGDAFESLLRDEIHDRGMQEPAADDET